jgi:hypothetical protein
MSKSNRVYTKTQRAEGPGTMVGVRLQPDQLAALDAWITRQEAPVTRPEAIRLILAQATESLL